MKNLSVHEHLNNLATSPLCVAITDKKTAKALLEQDTVFCCGDLRRIVVKHRGLGVYKVFTEPVILWEDLEEDQIKLANIRNISILYYDE